MELRYIKSGDIVECNVRGRVFFAIAGDRAPGRLRIRPIDRNITYHEAKATEVVGHYRRVHGHAPA